MYPFRVILLGPSDRLDQLASPLANEGVVVEGRFPDLGALRAGWKPTGPEPRLFAVWLQSPEDVAVVREINETLPGAPILALVESACDTDTVYRFNRAGAAQLVPVPWTEEDLAAALGVILRQFGRTSRVGRLIAVAAVPERDSAAFAVNLAAEIAARWAIDCILAEPTARLARLTAYLEVTPQTGAYDLLAGEERLTLPAVQQALTPAGDRLRLLPGPLQGIALQAPDPARLDRLVGLLRQLAGCVVLHVPNTFDPAQFAALAMAEHVVLLGGQQVPAIHSLKLLRESLLARRTAGTQHVVLHRYDSHQGGVDPKRLRELLQVDEVWTLADDPAAWMASINEGVPLRAKAPRSPALADLDRLIARLLGPPPG